MGNPNYVPDAPWIGHCREEWEEICNRRYSDLEAQADYEAEQAEIRYKEED